MHQKEHDEFFASIRAGKPINDGQRMAHTSLMAVMGRMAAYTGQEITWEQALSSSSNSFPPHLDWETKIELTPPPQPGVTKFFEEHGMIRFTLLTALVLAPLAVHAQEAASNSVRDRLWLFGVAGRRAAPFYEGAGYGGGSRIMPAEGASWLGVPNLDVHHADLEPAASHVAGEGLEGEDHQGAVCHFLRASETRPVGCRRLRRAWWSVELPDIVTLAKSYPNITGIYLDDFVTRPYTKRADGTKVGTPAMTEAQLKSMRDQLGTVGRPDGGLDNHLHPRIRPQASRLQRLRNRR